MKFTGTPAAFLVTWLFLSIATGTVVMCMAVTKALSFLVGAIIHGAFM